MADIILTTLNAKYAHCSFGLRYLMANLGGLQSRAQILEFDVNQRPLDVVEVILRHEPRIVGVGVYIWNATQSLQVVADLKRLRPDLTVILGGPEVSYECEQQEIARVADYVIAGEGDLAFADLCVQILTGAPPRSRVIPAPLPDFDRLALPYELYTDADIAHRVIYVEASRGCPYECEFCLSSLDVPVRSARLDAFLAAMQRLLDRGVRQFKFVDRTFNLDIKVSSVILRFFLERYRPGLFVHFEMIPDRLPAALREAIKEFPPGALQFEVGIQTFNEAVARLISRRQDNARAEENLRWLRSETGVHVHADLIVGLPGEDIASFAAGFDRLVALGPQEIQVGLLKRLRGTPIVRHDREWEMVYSPHPPYEILQTKLIDFFRMQRLRRFARYWDLVANSGNFIETAPLIWRGSSPFHSFQRFSDWLYTQTRQTHNIALPRLRELVTCYLTQEGGLPRPQIEHVVQRDAQHSRTVANIRVPPRQARHIAQSPQANR
ncbi:MAG TPA: radical SAM protein [Verrucomicrobiae bacterium]|nr:radical SAM protein [Verrucomicrobiae bacterium]